MASKAVTASSDTSEEREPMSSDSSTSEEEEEEEEEEEFSEFVRRPTRTAGDLSEVADGPAGITTEDVARDLESVASKSRSSNREGTARGTTPAGRAHRGAPRNCEYGPR